MGKRKKLEASASMKTAVVSSNWQALKQTLGPATKKRRTELQLAKKQQVVMCASQVENFKTPRTSLEPLNSDTSVSKILSMDCEMVGVGYGGKRSVLARVCLLNASGNVLLDKHVRPLERVTDYRTHVSGVRPKNLSKEQADDFWVVQKEVAALLKGRILVGHALTNDLKALLLDHPKRDKRDTAYYKPLQRGRGTPALKKLAEEVLGTQIQNGEHSPEIDARAALYIYLKYKSEWEQQLNRKRKRDELDSQE